MHSSHGGGSLDERGGPRYTIDRISNEQSLSTLQADWNKLSETAGNPNVFLTYGWFQAWVKWSSQENYGRILPSVFVIKENGAVVGIAPLVRRIASRLLRVRKLEFATHHADYNNLVLGADPAGQIVALVDHLAHTSEHWDVVDLRDLPDSDEGAAPIAKAALRAGLSCLMLPEKESCPYLSIDGDASFLMNRLSGHIRRVTRKRRERAAAEGLRTRVIENPHQEPGLLEKLIALDHQKSLRSVYPPFIGTYPHVFQSLFDELGPKGWLYVALLETGGPAHRFSNRVPLR